MKQYRIVTLLLFIVLFFIACQPVTPFTPDLSSVLSEIANQDAAYNTNWQQDNFSVQTSISQLSELSDLLQKKALELNSANQTMLSLLVASRGSIIESQISFAKAQAYGPEGIVKLPKGSIKPGDEFTVSCSKKEMYKRVAELYEQALQHAKKSAQAFGHAQKLATPSEQLRIQVPFFYRINYAHIEQAIISNKEVVKNCET